MINDVDIPLAKIMRPSPEEFNDFEQFIENLDQEKIFSNNGLVKVKILSQKLLFTEILSGHPSC